jgi:hypothetical protein
LSDILERNFNELRLEVGEVDRLSATRSEPFFHFVHRPEDTLTVRRNLTRWTSQLEQDGWRVRIVSLADLMWQTVDASGRWDVWREAEIEAELTEINVSVRDVLRDIDGESLGRRPGIANRVRELVADETPGRLLLLTDAALLHPWFRLRPLESWVHRYVRCPTVVFYPGRRSGTHGLQYLGFYAEDANYRSKLIGDAL